MLTHPTTGTMPTHPITVNTPIHPTTRNMFANLKMSSANIDIPQRVKPTSRSNYFEGTKSYMPSSNFPSTSVYVPTCGISNRDVVLAGSFKNEPFNLNFDTIQNTYDVVGNFEQSNNCFGPIVGLGRGRLNLQDTCRINSTRYYK